MPLNLKPRSHQEVQKQIVPWPHGWFKWCLAFCVNTRQTAFETSRSLPPPPIWKYPDLDSGIDRVALNESTVDSRLSARGLTALRLNRGNVFFKKKFYFP
jgi:hypothetical protein